MVPPVPDDHDDDHPRENREQQPADQTKTLLEQPVRRSRQKAVAAG